MRVRREVNVCMRVRREVNGGVYEIVVKDYQYETCMLHINLCGLTVE